MKLKKLMKLKEDVIGQRRRLAKYIKRLQRFASVFVDFWPILGGTLECSFGSVFEWETCFKGFREIGW
jgi:hypothetical protein